MDDVRACSKCKQEFPATLEYFHKDNSVKIGLKRMCKKCACELKNERYKNSSEEYKNNNHVVAKIYRDSHKEQIKINMAEWRTNNKEVIAGEWQRYYKINKNELRDNKKIWVDNNRCKTRIYTQRRRAKKKSLPNTLTFIQWEDMKEHFDNKCVYCGRTLRLYQDHFIPLSKGGEYTHNNILPTCQSCNSSKSNKDFFKFYPTYKYYSRKREKAILEFLHYDKGNQQISII